MAAGGFPDVGAETRRAMRDRFHDGALLDRCARDIKRLLLPDDADVAAASDDYVADDVVRLWDGGRRTVAGGTSYEEPDW